MQAYIDDKQLAGMVTVLARHGKVVHEKVYGVQDIATNTPMKYDSILRIFSMTKPVTGVALMSLFEEGKFRLSDPISPLHTRVQGSEGLRRHGTRRQTDPRSTEACPDDW